MTVSQSHFDTPPCVGSCRTLKMTFLSRRAGNGLPLILSYGLGFALYMVMGE